MKKSLVITDVTRMREGRVCIAGYDEDSNCIRPVLPPPGIQETSLYVQERPLIFPFAVVEYDLTQALPHPPHTEDYRYDPASAKFIEHLDMKRRREVLEKSLSESVAAIFEEPIQSDMGHYVMDGRGPRSLGTIRSQRIVKAVYEQALDGKWRYRLGFVDGDGLTYWLAVTDLAWRYFNDYERRKGRSPGEISAARTSSLKSSDVFLRVGLARGWEAYPDRCFLQITGIYSFPDYLDGRTFAEFAP